LWLCEIDQNQETGIRVSKCWWESQLIKELLFALIVRHVFIPGFQPLRVSNIGRGAYFLIKNRVKIIIYVWFLRKNVVKIIGEASFLIKNRVKIIIYVWFLRKNIVKIIGDAPFLCKNGMKIIDGGLFLIETG
jgi:hypothetical protein